ncbi:MAG: hypothetical protein ACRD2R_00705 [Terriglobales bacterium]
MIPSDAVSLGLDSARLRRKAAIGSMTAVEIVFRYGAPPEERDLRALQAVREVYGVRRLEFDERACTVRVEYDASRLTAEDIAALLRGAGLEIKERVALV